VNNERRSLFRTIVSGQLDWHKGHVVWSAGNPTSPPEAAIRSRDKEWGYLNGQRTGQETEHEIKKPT
jgi:hypothetical protein